MNRSLLLGSPHFLQSIVEALISYMSAPLCSSTALRSHQSDFSARVRFCSSLQASFHAAVVDLILMVCNTLRWDWSLLLIRVCSSWSLASNQSWCFLSGVPRYVLAVLYSTCCREPPIRRLVLRFHSTPSGREHCQFPAQLAYLSLACCVFVVF